MVPDNFLNFHEGEIDRAVYRIISTERLYQLFGQRRNVLVRPSKWEDPFENFILNARGRLTDGTVVRFGFNNDFFGQCWTLQNASDAMWRIYSPNKEGVRIRTTVRKLATGLAALLGEWAHVQAFIGRVQYLRKKELTKFANTVLQGGISPAALARTLLVKRRAFLHEKEVRLLYLEKDKTPTEDLFAYDIDPHVLIEQIMVDPRLTKDDADKLKADIAAKTNFKGEIKRSLLYAPPEDFVFPIGG